MTSKFGYRMTGKAKSDLEEIISYIAIELANTQAASDFMDKVQDKIEEIRAFPNTGVLVRNEFLQEKNVRRKSIENYIMYYLPNIKENIIYILRIVYGKRNLDDILREMMLPE